MIKRLEVQLTSQCNLNCYYCGNSPKKKASHIKTADFSIIKKCINDLNPKELVLTGGEPTLKMDLLKKIFSYSSSLGIANTLTSNFTILSHKDIKDLVENYNVSRFNSSFNDLNEDISKKIRAASYSDIARIKSNFSYIANELKLPIRVETLLIKDTINHINGIQNLLYSLGIRHLALEFLNPLGHANWDMMPTIEELVNAVLSAYDNKPNDMLLELTCNYLSPCDKRTEKIYKIKDKMFKVAQCRDGKDVAYLLATGELIPCFMYEGKIYDNDLHSRSAKDIWMNNEIFRMVRNEVPVKCKSCEFYYNDDEIKNCSNGCWAMLLSNEGTMKINCIQYILNHN